MKRSVPMNKTRLRFKAPRLLGTLLLGIGLLGSEAAHAQTECVLPPVAVPGLMGSPLWFASGGGDVRTELDDPRWGGAPIMSYANDSPGSTAGYRVLVNGNELNVSFQALVDPDGVIGAGEHQDNAAGTGDELYLGISTNSGGTAGKILRIFPRDTGGTDPVVWTPGLDYQLFEKTSAAGAWTDVTPGTPPTWLLDSVYTWRNSPVGAVWAVNLKVDLSGFGLASTSAFHMAFGTTLNTPSGSVDLHTPDYAGGTVLATGTLLPADMTTWPWYMPRGTACTSGVSLSRYSIGTNSATSDDQVDNGPNTFFAEPQNIPAPISVNKIRARFSIANWGSTVAVPNAGWSEFSLSHNGDGYVPDGILTSSTWTVPSPNPSAKARIEFTCAVTSGTYCPAITASSPNQDQCLLVELKAPGAPTVKFQNAAVYRNMTFAALSTIDRAATVSIKGLQKITGQAMDRDVYLYVQTKNMPGSGNKPMWLPVEKMAKAKAYAQHPPVLPGPNDDRKQLAVPMALEQGRAPAANAPGAAANAPPAGQAPAANPPAVSAASGSVLVKDKSQVPVLSPDQALMEVWPTYVVHTFYDTGRKRDVKGKKVAVLAPMVPFGFFLSHDGPLYGFDHSIRALDGAQLQEIAPNFYKIHVQNEGSVRVATRITANEGGPAGGGGGAACECCKAPPINVHVNAKGCYCSTPASRLGTRTSNAPLALLSLLVVAWKTRRRRVS